VVEVGESSDPPTWGDAWTTGGHLGGLGGLGALVDSIVHHMAGGPRGASVGSTVAPLTGAEAS